MLTYGRRQADCWKLYMQNTCQQKTYTETYWITKTGQEFLKEEDYCGDGTHRSKIKMPLNASFFDLKPLMIFLALTGLALGPHIQQQVPHISGKVKISMAEGLIKCNLQPFPETFLTSYEH